MLNEIEIFRAGSHISSRGDSISISVEDLAGAVAAYDPATSEAPLVVGHPAEADPAYGWVQSLSAKDGRLTASVKQIDPEFSELVKAGRYKNISASFYTPSSPHNPKPGSWYLRHVGFLGAQPPAIKGLKPVSFSASNDGVMDFSIDNKKDITMTVEEILAKEAALKAEADKLAKDKADFAEAQEAAIKATAAKQAEDLAAKLAGIEAREKALTLKEHESFAESLVKDGKILPAHKGAVVSFMAYIAPDSTMDFAEDGKTVKKPALESFKEFLGSLKIPVDFAEHSKGDLSGKDDAAKIGEEIAKYIPGRNF